VESCKYLGSILTNDGRCACEIKCGIAMAKAAFNKKRERALFTSTLDLELKKKLVKCYIWTIALYGAETLGSRSETRGRCRKLLDDLKERRGYPHLKEKALGSHYVESLLWKRLWTCPKTDY
jgi:hypothetical protein